MPKGPERQINYGSGKDVSDESVTDAGVPLRLTLGGGGYLKPGLRAPES